MKKLILSVFALSMLSAFASAEIGVGVKMGYQADKTNLEDFKAGNNDYTDGTNFAGGVEFFMEQPLRDQHFWGFRIGLEGGLPAKLENYVGGASVKAGVNYFTVPLTLYYKYKVPDTNLSIWGGAGGALGVGSFNYNFMSDETDTKFIPFIAAGAEVRFTKLFALGLDAKYNFNGKFKASDTDIYRDIKGFSAMLAGRFYFL